MIQATDVSLSSAECEQQAAMAGHLRAVIRAAGGWLDFAAYMHEALYAPELGYYVNGLTKFGPEGDFITAPELSPLFGLTLGEQLRVSLAMSGQCDIVELGAGSGALAASVLKQFRDAGQAVNYRIVEVSAELAARQQARLAEFTAPVTVSWVDALPLAPVNGFVIANEVIDALPVARFVRREEGVDALGVKIKSDALTFDSRPAGSELEDAVLAIESDLETRLPAGYVSEVCLALPEWLGGFAAALESGQLLFSDYGYSAAEYYQPARSDGTLMGHRRHRTSNNALHLPGLQDLTAWVDFSRLAAAGSSAGLTLAGYTHQAGFLTAGGIEQFVQQYSDPTEQLRLATELKTLMLPGEMGERFRFMALGRGNIQPLSGFGARDLRYAL